MKKNFKSKLLFAIVALFIIAATCTLTSCYALNNMSAEDAYNVGYGAGTLLRNL